MIKNGCKLNVQKLSLDMVREKYNGSYLLVQKDLFKNRNKFYKF